MHAHALRPSARRPVLLVEDNLDLAEIVRDVLIEAGYEVVSASDSDEAFERYCEMDRDCLVLLDLHLPSGPGEAVLARLSDLSRFHATVVAMTGGLDAPPQAVEVLRKPFEMSRLLTVVQRYCG